MTNSKLLLVLLCTLFVKGEHPGILVQVSQEGVDYITAVAERILPSILANLTVPETELAGGYTIKSVSVDDFDSPSIKANFVEGEGVSLAVHVDSMRLTGRYSSSWTSWWTSKGAIRVNIEHLHLEMMLLSVFNDTTKQAELTVPICTGSTSSVRVVFGGKQSTALNLVRGLLGEYLTNELDTIICDLTVMATSKMAEQIAKPTSQTTGAPRQSMLSTNQLCGAARMGLAVEDNVEELEDFSIDFSLVDDVQVFDNYSVVPFDAAMTFSGNRPNNTARVALPSMPIGQRMITFVVTEYTPNTFFEHVFNEQLGRMEKVLAVADLPKLMRKALETFCFGCEIRLVAELTSPPVITVQEKIGVQLYFEGRTRMIFDGPFKRFDLVNANVGLAVIVRPYVHRGSLFGKVDLNNVDVRIDELGVGGVIGDTIGGAFKKIIPRQLWPSIQRRLSIALDRKGMKLPVVCGLELKSTSISYIEHAVVVDTDFELDVDAFVNTFMMNM